MLSPSTGLKFVTAMICLYASAAWCGIDSKIREVEDEIIRSNAEFSALNEEINRISLEIDQLNTKKETASVKIDMIAANIRELTSKINNLNNDYKNRRDNLNILIAELEQTGDLARKSRIFTEENSAVIKKLCASSGDGTALLMHDFEEGSKVRIKSLLLGDLVMQVSTFAESCAAKQQNLASERKIVEKKIEELEAALGDFSSKVASNKKIQLSHKRSLDKIHEQQKTLRKELVEKEKSKKEIDRLLETFMKKKKDLLTEKEKERELDALRGRLPWPLAGSIVSPFGRHKHPVLDTHVINRGIKIEGSTECVNSVQNGTVSFAGYFKGYGKTVIIDHGGGFYTVTSGFGDIDVKTDEKVETSSKLGSVLPGDPLYFEIRRNGVPEDQLLWLLKQ